jgi:short-subunit dehydrogenase
MAAHRQFRSGTALITGASGGIGGHLARLCLARGMRVIAVGRNRGALESLAAEVPEGQVVALPMDLTEQQAVPALVERTLKAVGSLELLVNCAGFGILSPFAAEGIETHVAMARLNFEVPTAIAHALLPRLRESSGAILNVASLAAFVPTPNMAMLGATKAALLSWSVALHEEMRGSVAVTAFCPGIVRTGFMAAAGMEHLDLASRFFALDPERVAARALRAAQLNKSIAFASALDRAAAAAARCLPATLTARLARVVLRPVAATTKKTRADWA